MPKANTTTRVRGGAEGGPTARAARDQQERHRAEGSTGRIAARTPGKKAAPRKTAQPARPGAGRKSRPDTPVIPSGATDRTRARASASGKLSQTAGGPRSTRDAPAKVKTKPRPKAAGKTAAARPRRPRGG
jgi:hypothetical protein